MASEVRLILGKRTGIPIDEFHFVNKAKQSIVESLRWLDARAEVFDPEKISINEIHLVCAFEHLKYFEFVDLSEFSRLSSLTGAIGSRAFILKSSPFRLKPKPANVDMVK